MMLPAARIEHYLSGRLRLRIPEMRGDGAYFEGLEEALARMDGAGAVSVRTRTGSVLLEDFAAGLPALRRTAREERWFELVEEPARAKRRSPGPSAVEALTQDLDLATLRPSLVLILLALAALQAARGQVMVPALTLLWFAFELSRRSSATQTTVDWNTADHSIH
jgi:hypothetical protein